MSREASLSSSPLFLDHCSACQSPCAQSWIDLYALEISSEDCLSGVRALLGCPSKVAAARNYQGIEAQTLVNFLGRVLERLHLGDKHGRRCLRLLSKICKSQKIVPASYIFQPELLCVGNVRDRGGFSQVRDGEYLGRTVAIKDLKTSEDDFSRVFKHFCREIIGWKHLSHPNILPLLGVSVSTELHRFRILSQWMPNGNLVQYTKSNPEANRLQLLSDAASGVAYLHGLGIVHGDLKGINVLVDSLGIACIGDFGFMTVGGLGTNLFSESTDSLGGTLSWMSPELLGPSRANSKIRPTCESDCYALGMVIYEVLTGLRPFYRLSTLETVLAVVRGERPGKPCDAKSLGFSDTLWALVQLCWSGASADRPTAQQLLNYLSDASLAWIPPMVYPAVETDSDSDSSGSLWASLANHAN